MTKSPDAFRTISEVADWLGVQAHVLRFWESKFSQVKPVKRAGGRRYYRPADMQLLGGIKALLHDEGLTIKGVQKILREQGVAHVIEKSQSLEDTAVPMVADIDTTVVSFESAAAAKENAAQSDTAETPDDDDTADPVETGADDPPVQEDLTSAFSSKRDTETAAEPDRVEPDPEPEKPEPDISPIPTFLRRAAAPTPEPEPVSEPVLQAKVVEAPDPPALENIPYVPGVLARLAKIDQLTMNHAEQIAPIAEDLEAWLSRSGDAGQA